ncbi:MAG: hypothetical protein V2I46_03765 [Bacteroides sp.]|jgi:cellobiose phosphorylase|nr:hypothetical protein [Bacteroides sp.]
MKISNDVGLSVGFLENGSVESIKTGKVRVNLRKTSLYARSGTSLYLRNRKKPYTFTALTGPESKSQFKLENNKYFSRGQWEGLEYQCTMALAQNKTEWQWVVSIRNHNEKEVEIDLFFIQDAGLRDAQAGTVNEYYVSQYIERLVLEDEHYGPVICCRQNMKQSVGHPWLMLACNNGAEAASVDGMQFFGKTFRETGIPEGLLTKRLGGEYAGESSVLALQERPFVLKPGQKHFSIFLASYIEDHPEATSLKDLVRLRNVFPEKGNIAFETGEGDWRNPSCSYFDAPTYLPVDDLTEEDVNEFFGSERRHAEWENGQLLSFFKGDADHVVLKAKEIRTDRPHGHIMQANAGLLPDESIMSTNPFACGIFNAHLTQGNTNFNVLFSIYSNQFNQASEAGQRIFIKQGENYSLLGVPSAFEMGLNHCRWIYKSDHQVFQVRSWTSPNSPQVNLDFRVINGDKPCILVSHHFEDGINWQTNQAEQPFQYILKPGLASLMAEKFPRAQFRMIVQGKDQKISAGNDELLRLDGKRTCQDLFVFEVKESSAFSMSIIGEVVKPATLVLFEDADQQFAKDCLKAREAWKDLSLGLNLKSDQQDILAISEILPWFGMNALTHYLTPYGLEQFGGAAWGTRDVSQGPVDLLLNLGRTDAARQLLCTIFSNQNPDGGWPQWWMFDSYNNIRAHEAHGDIIYWTIIALAQYIDVTGDFDFLGEVLPYYHEKGSKHAESTPLKEHLDRLVKLIMASFIPGKALVPFGGGDWNDSLQPVSEELAARMISSWTVEMNYQAFMQWAGVLERSGDLGQADFLRKICERIRSDFNRHLVKDGIVAGYGLLEPDGSISVLLHPTDKKTGIHYSILPMERGVISGIFTREQAEHHQEIIEKHLKGPDGARLMDRPLKYSGGVQTLFQRAESSTFFGREIGLMYIHEHIRYAESLARTGRAEAFVKALRQAIPVGYRKVVPQGDTRQSNCYYSSSDIIFKSRYEADERYHEIHTGKWTFRGGWRVYSSGPGIFIGIIVSRLLGIRIDSGNLILDPVMPLSFNGLSASLKLMSRDIQIRYRITTDCCGPQTIRLNGKEISFSREDNQYRKGGAVIRIENLVELLQSSGNILEIKM